MDTLNSNHMENLRNELNNYIDWQGLNNAFTLDSSTRLDYEILKHIVKGRSEMITDKFEVLTVEEREILIQFLDFIFENENSLKVIYNKITTTDTVYYAKKQRSDDKELKIENTKTI